MSAEVPQLIALNRQAMNLKHSGEWDSAAHIYEEILEREPRWEQGYGAFNLAECYEQLGKLDEARRAYEKAVQVSPTDRTLLGGLASFLYLHAEAPEALNCHLQLLALEVQQRDTESATVTMTAVKALGARLGWTSEETERRIGTGSTNNQKHRTKGE